LKISLVTVPVLVSALIVKVVTGLQLRNLSPYKKSEFRLCVS
jgi:hypothetical protein